MADIIPRIRPEVTPIRDIPSFRENVRVPDLADNWRQVGNSLQQGVDVVRDHYEKRLEQENSDALKAARTALLDWENEAWDPQNEKGVYGYQGGKALGANEALVPQFDAKAAEIRGRLTAAQQARFDDIALGAKETFRNRLTGWMQREHDAYTTSERKAFVSNMSNAAVRAGIEGDLSTAAAYAQELLLAQASDLRREGAGPERLKAFEATAVSAIYTDIVVGIAIKDPMRAIAFYDRYAPQFSESDRATVLRTLQPYVEDAQADAWVEAIDKGGKLPDPVPEFTAPDDVEGVQRDYRTLGEKHGFSISSMQRPVIAAGAGARSQHPLGTAVDFSIKGKTKAEGDRLIADLRAHGYEVIDERDGTTGTGPHIHAELPPSRVARTPKGPTLNGPAPVASGGTEGTQRVSVLSPTMTDADRMERVQQIPDASLRRRVDAKMRDAIQIRKWREDEAERDQSERMNLAIEQADPSASLRSVLGSDYETAARKGWLSQFEARMRERRAGTASVSSVDLTDSLDRIVYQATMQQRPEALEYLRNFNAYDPKLRLSSDDRARFAKVQLSVAKNDSQGLAAAASDAEITQTIQDYRRRVLGIDDKASKTGEGLQRTSAFNQAMRLFVSDYTERNNGKKPSYRDLLQHADSLTLKVPVNDPGWFSDGEKPAAMIDVTSINQIPARYRQQIADALGANFTEQAAVDLYKRTAAAGRLPK